MDRPKNRLVPVLIVAGLPCMLLAAYAVSYFAGGTTMRSASGGQTREFWSQWACAAYSPAARIEAIVTGTDVALCFPADGNPDVSQIYNLYSP